MQTYKNDKGVIVKAWFLDEHVSTRVPEELYYHKKTPVSITSQYGGEKVWAEIAISKNDRTVSLQVPYNTYLFIDAQDTVQIQPRDSFEQEFHLVKTSKKSFWTKLFLKLQNR